MPSSLLIVYEGYHERCEFLSPGFYFLNPVSVDRRSNSDCGCRRAGDDENPHFYANESIRFEKAIRAEQLDFDWLSIMSCYLTDDCDSIYQYKSTIN